MARTVVCTMLFRIRGRDMETPTEAMRFKVAFGRNKKGKVFGTISQLKKLSKSNDVHAQNKTF